MAFITATFLIDAPASALNNSGEPIPNARTDNTSAVKFIRTKQGDFPYVSAQAFRYWLRMTMENDLSIEWKSSPIYREDKVAYTDANPLEYWDDDLFGYMRAPSKKRKGADKTIISAEDPDLSRMTGLEDEDGESTAVTRAAPFRVSTLVSIAPVTITADFGTMSRQEGNPAPYEHQFYRTTLLGSFSLDLGMAGTFSYRRRTGFKNLDKIRREKAQGWAAQGYIEHLEDRFAYRLPAEERIRRISSLLAGLSRIQGGAKQSLHYTDVMPAAVVVSVISGGNNPFAYVFTQRSGIPVLADETLMTVTNELKGHQALIADKVYVGWKPGFLPEEASKLSALDAETFVVGTPRSTFESVISWLHDNPDQLDA